MRGRTVWVAIGLLLWNEVEANPGKRRNRTQNKITMYGVQGVEPHPGCFYLQGEAGDQGVRAGKLPVSRNRTRKKKNKELGTERSPRVVTAQQREQWLRKHSPDLKSYPTSASAPPLSAVHMRRLETSAILMLQTSAISTLETSANEAYWGRRQAFVGHGSVPGREAVLRLRLQPPVVRDVLEGGAHDTAVAPPVGLVAVHQLLLGEGHQRPRADLVDALHGACGRERPAAACSGEEGGRKGGGGEVDMGGRWGGEEGSEWVWHHRD